MGRITIFSADGCPHCQRVKVALASRRIPFAEISVTKYPAKRQDMLALSDRVSTPQVFFNTRHVGGADETIALLHRWDKEKKKRYPTPYDRYVAEIGDHFDPGNPRLGLPTGPPPEPEASPHACRGPDRSVTLPNGQDVSVGQATELLKEMLPCQDHVRKLTNHKRTFTGRQAVVCFVRKYGIDVDQAVQWGRQLQQRQFFHAVARPDAEVPFDDDDRALFRLQCYATPYILNSYCIWADEVDPDAMRLLNRLTHLMGKIEASVTNDHEASIDYGKAVSLPLFPVFEEAVCELQCISLSCMDDKTKTAFGINLYNLMIKYAFMKVGAGANDIARYVFYNAVGFKCAGHVFSFQDWENGILRGNRKAPYAIKLQFDQKDPRLALTVKEPDCRLHFGLNCGARSCPPVNNYSAENLEEELAMAANSFCEDDHNVYVDVQKKQLHISKIFAWYKVDFAANNKELPGALVKYLRRVKQQDLERLLDAGAAIKVVFKDYDWSSTATNVKPFDSTEMKLSSRTLKGLLGNSHSKEEKEVQRFANLPEQTL